MFDNLIEFIKNNIVYAIIIIISMWILTKLFNLILKELQARIHDKWKERQEKKKEIKLKKVEEKAQKKYSYIKANNWLLNYIISFRIIIFKGLAGKGKTTMMQVISKFLIDKFEFNDKKNQRYNKIMNPGYLIERVKLKENVVIPVYTNMDNISNPNNGYLAQKKALEVLQQKIKINAPAVVQIDEIGSLFPKSSIFQVRAEKNKEKKLENNEIKEFARKLRHYGAWLLGTEQDGDDFVKDIRQFGFAEIEVLQTTVQLLKKGKRIQNFKIFINKWFIGLFVSNLKWRFRECLFFRDYFKTFFKLFLPAFVGFEKNFYIKRNEIYKDIKLKYTIFKTFFKFENKFYWLNFNNKQKLSFDTLAYESEYLKKFDENGQRKYI